MKTQATLPIRILTHNIRYAASPPASGEKPWPIRKRLIINELKHNTLYNPESFICLQEVLHEQLADILHSLNTKTEEWAYIGVGRDDGKQAGEYSPILYRTSVWKAQSWRTVWLNEKQEVGKKGWDAGSVRIVTVGSFKHVESKKRVVGLCTHFDNTGEVARRESAKIILSVVEGVTRVDDVFSSSFSAEERLPFFVAGDLNSNPTEDAYQILGAETSLLQDAEELAKWKYGNQHTFTDFDDGGLEIIDFVFVGPRGGGSWGVEGYSVLANRFEDGVYGSDHRAVVVDGVLEF